MTVGELLRRVSSQEMTLWKLYLDDEPIGFEMENWRFAMLAKVMTDPYIKKGSKKPDIKHFMPKMQRHAEGEDESIRGDPIDPREFT